MRIVNKALSAKSRWGLANINRKMSAFPTASKREGGVNETMHRKWCSKCSKSFFGTLHIMLGGDAFITKPYNTAILLAKIASLLRRAYASGQSETLTWNGVDLHLESSLIEYNGQKAELTKNELKILYYLFKNAGKICPRSDIVDFLWDNQLYVDDNALSVNITRIREKLASIGLTDFIKTKHRQGYTL